MSGCGGVYIAAAVIALQDDGSTSIDQSKPDLVVTNLQGPPVGTIVAITSDTEAGPNQGTTIEFFEPVRFNVLNSGSDVAPAGYSVSLFLSRTKQITPQSIRIRRTIVNATTQVAEFTRVESTNSDNIAAISEAVEGFVTISAGNYFLLARVGGADETDTTNNDTLAVGQVRIYDPRVSANDPFPEQVPANQGSNPNFVLERVFVPSFAFAQDAVNASQQTVSGQRLANISAQVALRGAATTNEELMELRLVLSTDQELSADDLTLMSPSGQPLRFTFPASSAGTVRQFAGFSVLLPQIQEFPVALPQTFFIIGQITPMGAPGVSPQELGRDSYDNVRAAETRTRVYGRFLQSGKAILPDLTVDSPARTDPDALEFTTTAFSVPTPGSQRIFSFEIPDVANINPDESQVLVLLQSNDFDPVLELLGPTGNTVRFRDDSENGLPAFVTAPLSSTGTGNNVFYVVISSRSGTGSGTFNLTIFLQSRTDANREAIQPINLGNLLSLDRARATIQSGAVFPVALAENSQLTLRVDGETDVPVVFQSGGLIADLAQATAEEVRGTIQVQADMRGALVDVSVSDGKLLLSSTTIGRGSDIQVIDGVGEPAAALGLPVGEVGLSERAVIFDFRPDTPDTQFTFFVPERGAFAITTEPSLDLFGGVDASLQFFDGVSQRAIPLNKSSVGSERTIFRAVNEGPLVLGRGFYSLILRAPQAIPNTDYRLQFEMRFDRTVNPQ